jgi:hypothetical protein
MVAGSFPPGELTCVDNLCQRPERMAFRMKLKAIHSASKKFLRTRETFYIFPNMQGFAQLVGVTIELYESFDPDGKKSQRLLIAFGVWRSVLTILSDVTRLWKKWIRFLKHIR